MPVSKSNQNVWSYYQTRAPETFRGSAFRLHFLTRYLKSGQRVLNVGIGGGLFEGFCRHLGAQVFSLDPDWMSLHTLRDKNGVQLTAGKLEDLPFGSDAFDAVIVSEVLEHLTPESTLRALKEIKRALVPGGQVIGTVPCEESLADGVVMCPECGEVFHKVGHLQSFSTATMFALLRTVFPRANCFEHAFMAKATSGPREAAIGLIRNRLVLARLLTREKHIVFRAMKEPSNAVPCEGFPRPRSGATQRLALFLPSLAGGGAEKRMLNLAAEFARRGHAVDMLLSKSEGAYLGSVPPRVRVIDLHASRPLTAIPALARYLSSEKPQALLSTITSANLAAVLASQLSAVKTRCVLCEASNLSIELRQSPAHNRFLMPLLLRRFFPKAHALVAVSHGVADDLARVTGIPRRSIRVIYNPVVCADLLAKSREPTEHPWLQNGPLPVIVAMGRLTRQKGFSTLLRAFALVRERLPSRLIILGEGEERPILQRLSLSLCIDRDVDLPGFVLNPYPFLSRASLFVLSSRWEGLPWVLIEALACGTKVVATDCPSGPREILDNGAYGQLCPVEDVPAMAAAMTSALTGAFVAADPTHWLEQFSLEANSARYLEISLGREADA
ncbi:MAG: glycosyltransferase [Desulfobacterota bacterium]|jgi:glycosyltransferase involved in cell wall biosynthesis/SAM-dependent methyltransferase|nr:glycosyltransferase [Thermodesulfobacteriota bacterium]